jgi:hypothetical protein
MTLALDGCACLASAMRAALLEAFQKSTGAAGKRHGKGEAAAAVGVKAKSKAKK